MYHANGQIAIYLPICFPASLPSLLSLCWESHPCPLLRGNAESWLQLGFCLLSSISILSSVHPSLIPAGLSLKLWALFTTSLLGLDSLSQRFTSGQ